MRNFLKFRFTMFIYPVDIIVDGMLNKLLDIGIKSIQSECYYFITIEFNNGSIAKMWNENKYYAWLSSGKIDRYRYNGGRPTRKTMRKLFIAMQDYVK